LIKYKGEGMDGWMDGGEGGRISFLPEEKNNSLISSQTIYLPSSRILFVRPASTLLFFLFFLRLNPSTRQTSSTCAREPPATPAV
jgi:hypothetical protein